MKRRITGQDSAALGIRPTNLPNLRLSTGEIIIQSDKDSPLWRLISVELPSLLAHLNGDPKYAEHIRRIGELLGDPQFPEISQVLVKQVVGKSGR